MLDWKTQHQTAELRFPVQQFGFAFSSPAVSSPAVWCRVFQFRDFQSRVFSSPMNSADRRSVQFTINKIVYKVFGAVSKDLYFEISAHFGIESVENLVANRRNRFINRCGETDNYLCQMLR